MSGADDRPGAVPPELLQALREADAWLARRPPARALEQRILAADPAPRGAGLLRVAQIAVPVALLIVYAFDRSRREPTRATHDEAARTLQLGGGEAGVIHRVPDAPDPPPPPVVTPTAPEYDDIDDIEPTPVVTPGEAAITPSTTAIDESAPGAPAPGAASTPRRVAPGVVPAPASDQTPSPIATPQVGPPTSGGGTASPAISGGSDPSPAHARPTPRPPPTPEAPRDDDPGDTVEVHVIGVYDSYAAASDREGEASLHITRPGRHIVVLSAYAETRWTLTVGDDVEVVQLLALGYEPQSVAAAPAGAMVDVMDASGDGGFLGCGYEYPDTELSGCETDVLLAQIESLLALPVTSFHGCYAASSFVLADDLGVASDCWTEAGYALTGFP